MARMKCCAKCFGDQGLHKRIQRTSDEVGVCSYCGSEKVALVLPRKLAERFELLIGTYQAHEDGRLLIEWLRADWSLFTHPKMDNSRAKDLLAEILDDGEIVRSKFVPSIVQQANRLVEWEELREELMYKNRFFPEVNIDKDRLKYLLSWLTADAGELPTTWFRARIQQGNAPYDVKEMGAPPRQSASHGRANPAGIPYLYLASTGETA